MPMPTVSGAVRPLFALTDEELAVLAGADQGPVAMPHLEALGGEARRVAVHTAYRCMLASGLVSLPTRPRARPATSGQEPGGEDVVAGDDLAERSFPVELPAELDAVLVLREGAPVLLSVQRQLAGEQVLRYVHLVEEVALVEDVLATGLHRFGRVPREELACCLQQFLVPDDAVIGSGTLTVDLDTVDLKQADLKQADPRAEVGEAQQLLARATVNADALVRHDAETGPGELLGMFLGPEGSWATSNRFGAGGPLAFEPLDPTSVGARLVALVSQAEQCVTMRP